ncbi:MAG: mandelate racemase/muconate lactonizing enzyme family protein, partial [Halocynthiibacter sp.]
MERVKIDCLDVFCFRVPIDAPVSTSFGRMLNRPGVFVRITDRDGVFGWGEVFANWPAAGAEHRAQLLMQDIADLVLGFEARQPTELFYHLCARTHIRALQCGEWGPFAQVIAGLDTALHDLFARRSGLALARFLNPSAGNDVQLYASGIHVENGSGTIEALRADGHRSFKVKIGFDVKSDLRHLTRCASALQPGEQLFADANQAWSLENAMVFADAARELGLGWIEEPLCADKPEAQWAVLADAC